MSLFSKYRPKNYKFYEPERFTPAEARARRLTALLERDRRFAELPNFKTVQAALSQAPKKTTALGRKAVNDQVAIGHKASLTLAAKIAGERYRASGFRDRQAFLDMQKYTRAAAMLSPARQGRSSSNADNRFFNPMGKGAYRTSGVVAGFTHYALRQVFKNPGSVIPCIQRSVRREVMFAKGKAGKGYRAPKRRTWMSGVPC